VKTRYGRNAIALAALAVTMSGAAIAAPDRADAVISENWPGAPICAQGTLTTESRTWARSEHFALAVRIEPCPGTASAAITSARWGLARYFDDAAYTSSEGPQRFNGAGPTVGTMDAVVSGGPATTALGDARAFCLITGPTQRVACVRVVAGVPANTVAIEPLPVNDALVLRTVSVAGKEGTDPACAACA
jgi:hypothetical protein